MSGNISYRPIDDNDLDFLGQLYASTRTDEMALVPWSDEEKEQFLRFQFKAQHTDYQRNYPDASFELILLAGQPIGRVYSDWREDELRIIDIALMPEHRGRGIGGGIMRDLMNQAAAKGKAVRIHVERNNPAMHLYERLGFQKLGDTGVYFLMECKPEKE